MASAWRSPVRALFEISRPDKIRLERKGGFADIEAVFDGKTLSLLGRNLNLYAQIPMAGDIDQAVGELRDKYGRPLPAADLLMSDSYKQIMPEVKDLKYLGPGVILGQTCEHVAMRADDVDLQLWIAQGDKPYPCRYTITSRTVPGEPQYYGRHLELEVERRMPARRTSPSSRPPAPSRSTPPSSPIPTSFPLTLPPRTDAMRTAMMKRLVPARLRHLCRGLRHRTRRPCRGAGQAGTGYPGRGHRRQAADARQRRRRRPPHRAPLRSGCLLLLSFG